jgi:hypothetical protein
VSAYEDSLCDHCDIPKAYCVHGSKRAAAIDAEMRGKTADLTIDGPTITATQSHPCPGCPDYVIVGQTIVHTVDGWAHVLCATPEGKPPTTDSSMFEGID